MKNFLLSLFLILSFSIFAGSVGNPSSPNLLKKGFFIPENYWFDLCAGYEGNFTFDRRLEQHKGGMGRVDNFEIYANSGMVIVNFVNRLDLFGIIGNGKIEADFRVSMPSTLTRVVSKSKNRLFWALGTNVLLLEWGAASLGIGGKYTSLRPGLRVLSIDGVPMNTHKGRFRYHEWQTNLALSYVVEFLIPYIGIKYSTAKARIRAPNVLGLSSNGGNANFFKSRENVGLYLGCTITSRNIFLLNLEARLIDEEAVTVLAEFGF